GAVALGFPFSKEPIAGIQPIEQMIEDGGFGGATALNTVVTNHGSSRWRDIGVHVAPGEAAPSPFGTMTQLVTPLSLSGFTPATIRTYAAQFRSLGFEPQEGVSAGSPISHDFSGNVTPGAMISVQLLSGDMSIGADGTVTYVDGKRVYAFGHRFLDVGSTELPFARSEVLAVVPTLNTSFKVSTPKEWVGTILSDRSTTVAGEIGRPAHTIPLAISVKSGVTGTHSYHLQVVNDRFLTPFIAQTALFSAIDATERTIGAGTIRLNERIEFEGSIPPLVLRDAFVSDSALAQQVAMDAVVSLGFALGAGFQDLRVKAITIAIEPEEAKRQLYVAQAWTSAHEIRPGETVTITALLAGENGFQTSRSIEYKVPIGAPAGALNFTVSDANTINFPEFAGMNSGSAKTAAQLIDMVNKYRGSQAAYIRVWRAEPAFTISGPSPGGELTDPPPSVMLILADPSMSPTSNAAQVTTRGSAVAELTIPVEGYVISGARTVQVEVKE
ncbi:MAG: hypothetical protein JO061_21840, partial [Acidobacteriaceae bacterium]|nr:hypothetical protein [Acidobacteriaceae bacterium]